MFSEAENVVDSYYFPFYYLFTLLPIILVISSPTSAALAATAGGLAAPGASTENQFLVYRVHHIDMPYGRFGSRSSVFNLEAITPAQLPAFFVRKCALFKWKELLSEPGYEVFTRKILQHQLVAGALVIFDDLTAAVPPLTTTEMVLWNGIEKRLLNNETTVPIYFVQNGPEISKLYDDYLADPMAGDLGRHHQHQSTKSLKDFLFQNVFFDSYQLVVNGPQTTPVNNPIVTCFQTKLIGAGLEDQIPTYAIVSHYDSYSIVPSLSYGADSNASGLIIFMELMRIFSKLYANMKTKPKANLVFLLSGGGKLNYFGTKKWLEENLDSSGSVSNTMLENMQFALCLESLADSMDENGLFMYVSKPPRSGTPAAAFLSNLQELSRSYHPSLNTTMIHKKINLAEDYLFWEHERFSLKRIAAFTLTSLPTSKIIRRRTLIDFYSENHLDRLETHTNLIGEALARQLYGPIKENLLSGDYGVSRESMQSLFRHVTRIPRAQNLLFTTINTGAGVQKDQQQNYRLPPLLRTIQLMMKKYSENNVRAYHFRPDAKNPEFQFYEPVQTKMFIYKTKPAVFDLFITVAVVTYLVIFFLVVKYFNYIIILTRSCQFLLTGNGNGDKDLLLKMKTK